MQQHIVQTGEWPSVLARKYTGKDGRWPELCAANPQCPKHATYGCVYKTGDRLNIPDSWLPGIAAPAVLPPASPAASPAVEIPSSNPAQPTVVIVPGSSAVPGPSSVSPPAAAAAAAAAQLPAAAPKSGYDPELVKKLILAAGILGFAAVMYFRVIKNKDEAPQTPRLSGPEQAPETLRSMRANRRPIYVVIYRSRKGKDYRWHAAPHNFGTQDAAEAYGRHLAEAHNLEYYVAKD